MIYLLFKFCNIVRNSVNIPVFRLTFGLYLKLKEVEDKIGFIIILIVDLKLTKSTSLGLNYSCIINIVFKILEFSIKL